MRVVMQYWDTISVMSTQIALRLPDDLVEQLDERVRQGVAANRSELIRVLLARELRRIEVEAEVAVLSQSWDDPDDLAALADWSSGQPLEG